MQQADYNIVFPIYKEWAGRQYHQFNHPMVVSMTTDINRSDGVRSNNSSAPYIQQIEECINMGPNDWYIIRDLPLGCEKLTDEIRREIFLHFMNRYFIHLQDENQSMFIRRL